MQFGIHTKGILSTRFRYVVHRAQLAIRSIVRIVDHESLLLQLVGVTFALIIYYLSLHQVDLIPLRMRKMLLSSLILVCSVTVVFLSAPPTPRCFLTLVVFNFISSASKICLTTIVLKSILNGPVNNTITNVERTIASFKCQSDLIKSIGKMMDTKGLSPSNRVLDEISRNSNNLKTSDRELGELVNVLHEELEYRPPNNVPNPHRFLKTTPKTAKRQSITLDKKLNARVSYQEKQLDRCESVLYTGEMNCRLASNQLVKTICLPGECIYSILAPQVANGCQTSNFKEFGTNRSQSCRNRIVAGQFDSSKANLEHLDQLVELTKEPVEFENVFEKNESMAMKKPTLYKLEADFLRLNANAKSTSDYIRMIIACTQLFESVRYLLVFYYCFKYLANYVQDIRFDNAYITRYFTEIDTSRLLARRHKPTLLPLKRFEAKFIFSPFQFYISKHQNPKLKLRIAITLGLMIFLLISIIVDYFVFDFLVIFRAQVVLNYSYETRTEMWMRVEGKGAVARTMRTLAGPPKSTSHKGDSVSMRQNKCMPEISSPNVDQLITAFIQVFMLVLLVLVDVYLKRFNRTICALFHLEWEKKRAQWLYATLLSRRKSFLTNARNKIFLKLRNGLRGMENSSLADRSLLNQNFRCLKSIGKKIFGLGRKYCALCDDQLDKWIVECETCSILYCGECVADLQHRCVCTLVCYDETYLGHE